MTCLASLVLLAGVIGSSESALAGIERQQQHTRDLVSLLGNARNLGPWGQNQRVIADALESIWRKNGWTTESDQFARKLMERVSEHPPWQLNERFQTFCDLLANRYDLDASQRQELRAIVTRDVWTMFFKHSNMLLRVGKEVLEARVARKPFTGEQAARWSRDLQPLTGDLERTVAGWATELESRAAPGKRELIRQDLSAYRRRLSHSSEMMDKWARGQWRAAEWGLEKDPIQMGLAAASTSQPATRDLEQAVKYRDVSDEWERYVRQFVARYQLDESQQVTARSILTELRSRAAFKLARRQDDAGNRAAEALFAELKKRLDTIPTQAQRARADSASASGK
jgi:hypothetical protein